MAFRAEDWLRQAERDLEHARRVLTDGTFEWAAFAAQQAAEELVSGRGAHGLLHGGRGAAGDRRLGADP